MTGRFKRLLLPGNEDHQSVASGLKRQGAVYNHPNRTLCLLLYSLSFPELLFGMYVDVSVVNAPVKVKETWPCLSKPKGFD